MKEEIKIIDGREVLIKPVRNTGFIFEPEAQKDYIEKSSFNPDAPLGRISTAPELPIIFPDGHGWHDESVRARAEMQFNPNFDLFSCIFFTIAKGIVSYLSKVYNIKTTVSEIFNAMMAGVKNGVGTSYRAGLESFRLHGWVEDKDFPFSINMRAEQFFGVKPPLTIQLKAKGKLTEWNVHWEALDYSGNVPHSKIIEGLKKTPILCSGFGWASFLGEGIYNDYNNQPNHAFPVDDWADNPEYDLLAYDSYPQDHQYDENSDDSEFVKKLSKSYRIWSAHRIFLTLRDKKKDNLILKFKTMWENFISTITPDQKSLLSFFLKQDKEGKMTKQLIDINDQKSFNQAILTLLRENGLSKSMKYEDVIQIPDKKWF